MSIREKLLAEDSTGCLQLLMRYPPDQDVSTIIGLSLSLGDPAGYNHAQALARASGATAHLAPPSSDQGLVTPSSHSDSTPRWLMDGSRQLSGTSGGHEEERRRSLRADSDRGEGGMSRFAGGGATAVRGSGAESGGEAKNNWQQGLDELTRR